jgi:hypothetical protein
MRSPRCGRELKLSIATAPDVLAQEQRDLVWRTQHSQRFSGKLHSESAECHMQGPGLQVVAVDRPTGRARGPAGYGVSSIEIDGSLKSSREQSSRLKRCSSRYDAMQHQSHVLTGGASSYEPRVARRVDPGAFSRQFAGVGVSTLMNDNASSADITPLSRIPSAAASLNASDCVSQSSLSTATKYPDRLSIAASVRQKMLAGAGSFW